MAKVYCPRCKSEVILPEKSSTVVGRTISEETPGSYALPLKNNRTTPNNKENKNMNNFDIETLAKMVAAQLSANAAQISTPAQSTPAPLNTATPAKVKLDEISGQKTHSFTEKRSVVMLITLT